MKKFKISYSKYVPTYDIEIRAESMSKAVKKAEQIIFDKKNVEIDIWNIAEKVEETINNECNSRNNSSSKGVK